MLRIRIRINYTSSVCRIHHFIFESENQNITYSAHILHILFNHIFLFIIFQYFRELHQELSDKVPELQGTLTSFIYSVNQQETPLGQLDIMLVGSGLSLRRFERLEKTRVITYFNALLVFFIYQSVGEVIDLLSGCSPIELDSWVSVWLGSEVVCFMSD